MNLPDPNNDFWWVRFVGYGAFASFAGMVGHLLRTIDSNEKIIWRRAIVEGASAGFVGVLVLLLCQALGLGEEWTGVIVGVSGWLGANATIQLLEKVIRNKLGVNGPTAQEFPHDDNDRPH